MTIKSLNCYCDHCVNNTCSTSQLCYAEWKLDGYVDSRDTLATPFSALSTPSNLTPTIITTAPPTTPTSSSFSFSSSSSLSSSASTSAPGLALPPINIRLKKDYNCFEKDDPLFIKTVCNETVTNTSHVIRRCCQSGDYCNRDSDLLPSESEAIEEFRRHYKVIDDDRSNDSIFAQFYEQYSNLPLGIQIILTILIIFVLVYSIVLMQSTASRRRRRRRNNCGIIDIGSSGGPSGHICKHDEDYSEYSSVKANSDVTVFDTNSMASRKPLINVQSRLNSGIETMTHQHPGPFMAEETYNGRVQSTFQMTLGSAADDLCRQDTSSGSGAGQPYLTQRSIAHDIQLVEVVGQGFFGVVWRGEYKGEPVAVKIFSAIAEPSWEREAEIYQTTMLRHKNILGFIATDKRQDATLTGYWLVTDYYPMGSLYDFLKVNTLSMPDAVRMAFSIANGLSHLHIEIFGTKGKPAISHRDLKSKNILVKNDGTCCIADLGMAVRYNSHTGIVDVPTSTRIGTRRYLAPEILENKLNLMDFESVKATDIYALGLVLWEIFRRTCLMHPSPGTDPGFSMPFTAEQQTTAPTTPSRSTSASPRQAYPASAPLFTPAPTAMPQGSASRPDPVFEDSGSGFMPPQQMPPPKRQRTSTTPPLQQPEDPHVSSILQEQMQMRPPSRPLTAQEYREFLNETMDTTAEEPTNAELPFLCEPYEAPYAQYVQMDPGTEEMREVVCVRKIRPPLSARWSKFASMRDYVNLMTECWYEKPQARLSALRVRKSLSDVARKHFNVNMEYD